MADKEVKKTDNERKLTIVGAGGFLETVEIRAGETQADALAIYREEHKA